MKSLERNMSRNLARLKYSTPAVLVALVCLAVPSIAMAAAHGSGLETAAARPRRKPEKTGATAQVAPLAPSAQSLSANVTQGASSQAVVKTAPSIQSLQPIASQSVASQAALKSAPSLQSLSVSVIQGSTQAATLPKGAKHRAGSLGASRTIGKPRPACRTEQLGDVVRSHAIGAEPHAARLA